VESKTVPGLQHRDNRGQSHTYKVSISKQKPLCLGYHVLDRNLSDNTALSDSLFIHLTTSLNRQFAATYAHTSNKMQLAAIIFSRPNTTAATVKEDNAAMQARHKER
jgi:hypothetical protein